MWGIATLFTIIVRQHHNLGGVLHFSPLLVESDSDSHPTPVAMSFSGLCLLYEFVECPLVKEEVIDIPLSLLHLMFCEMDIKEKLQLQRCIKLGHMEEALQVVNSCSEREIVTWNHIFDFEKVQLLVGAVGLVASGGTSFLYEKLLLEKLENDELDIRKELLNQLVTAGYLLTQKRSGIVPLRSRDDSAVGSVSSWQDFWKQMGKHAEFCVACPISMPSIVPSKEHLWEMRVFVSVYHIAGVWSPSGEELCRLITDSLHSLSRNAWKSSCRITCWFAGQPFSFEEAYGVASGQNEQDAKRWGKYATDWFLLCCNEFRDWKGNNSSCSLIPPEQTAGGGYFFLLTWDSENIHSRADSVVSSMLKRRSSFMKAATAEIPPLAPTNVGDVDEWSHVFSIVQASLERADNILRDSSWPDAVSAVPEETKQTTLELFRSLRSLLPSDPVAYPFVAPTPDGSLLVEWRNEQMWVTLEIDEGTMMFVIPKPPLKPTEDINAVASALKELLVRNGYLGEHRQSNAWYCS
jgi:hypothetical protein